MSLFILESILPVKVMSLLARLGTSWRDAAPPNTGDLAPIRPELFTLSGNINPVSAEFVLPPVEWKVFLLFSCSFFYYTIAAMHSTLVRIQNVFGFLTSVATCLGVLVLLSSFLVPQSPAGVVELSDVQV